MIKIFMPYITRIKNSERYSYLFNRVFGLNFLMIIWKRNNDKYFVY